MRPGLVKTCAAFAGHEKIADGSVLEVALAVKGRITSNPKLRVLIFDDETSAPVEIDFRGDADEVAARLREEAKEVLDEEAEKKTGPGRPKLGVIAREVTLLPRHWEWLSSQSGGASATLRRLVEEARRRGSGADERRRAQDATYRFMTVMAGDLPHYEEALRAIYAGQKVGFETALASWPRDIKKHALKLAEAAFEENAVKS